MSFADFGDACGVQPWVTELTVPVKNVLMVGNSFFFNCGVHGMISGIAKTKGIKLVMTMVGIGGASLYWHDVKSYLRPNGIRSYTIANDGSNKVEFIDYPDGRIFDVVVLEDSSQGPIHPGLKKFFAESSARHCADIRATGAEPIFTMTWAYKDMPEMTRALADATIEVANANSAPVVPCGLAFARSLREHPEIELIRTDNRHPTVAGTYLEACVFFASLTKTSPVGSDYCGRYEDMSVDVETAGKLQQVAWDTVCDFNGWEK